MLDLGSLLKEAKATAASMGFSGENTVSEVIAGIGTRPMITVGGPAAPNPDADPAALAAFHTPLEGGGSSAGISTTLAVGGPETESDVNLPAWVDETRDVVAEVVGHSGNLAFRFAGSSGAGVFMSPTVQKHAADTGGAPGLAVEAAESVPGVAVSAKEQILDRVIDAAATDDPEKRSDLLQRAGVRAAKLILDILLLRSAGKAATAEKAGAVEAEAAEGSSGTVGLKAVRGSYIARTLELYEQAKEAVASGRSAEDVAREFVPKRNALKLEERATGSWVAARAADVRNLVLYRDKAGPSADALYAKYGSWDAVIESLGRTSKTINRFTGN